MCEFVIHICLYICICIYIYTYKSYMYMYECDILRVAYILVYITYDMK